MLVIARKINERFKIHVPEGVHGDIEIVITDVTGSGTCVRIGIEAPREMGVTRDDAVSKTRKVLA
jgi:carbon storage regulator CsrA